MATCAGLSWPHSGFESTLISSIVSYLYHVRPAVYYFFLGQALSLINAAQFLA